MSRLLPFALGLFLLGHRTVLACAMCSCGDPTLTATGVEKPYRNRLRLGLEERGGWYEQGEGEARRTFGTLKSTLTIAWSPGERATLALVLPWSTTWVSPIGKSQQFVSGLGDLETSVRLVLLRDQAFSPRHLFWLTAALAIPTAPRLRDDSGHPYPDDDQPGSGGFSPALGATYGWFGDHLSAFTSMSYRLTSGGPRGYRRGTSLGFLAALQHQPVAWSALQLGLTGVWAEPDSLANGSALPNTGGTLVSLAPALLVAPIPQLLVRLGAEIPALQFLTGTQHQGLQLLLSLAYDIH